MDRRFFARATSVLFKDAKRGSGDCGQSSKTPANPCQTKSTGTENPKPSSCEKNPCANPPKAPENLSKQSTSASTTAPCASGTATPGKASQGCSSAKDPCLKTSVDDPCARECKLSHPTPCSDDTPKNEPCLEPPPAFCPPSADDARKANFWKRATIMGVLPIALVASIVIKMRAREEAKRPRPEFVPMEHMYRRTKRFPWGDGNHSLFHNPEKNAVPPHGYEAPDPNAVTSE